ncbi:MAG TPA: RNA polymerase sigma factor [Flavisolibacter sp.]|nr:RNA polymerase sigma factor [Flavisolibacter sp.]
MPLNNKEHVGDISSLIEMCNRGDRFSQSRLYNIFAPKMFAICLRYSRSREEAEEILQEGFVKVFQMVSQFQNKGVFEGWIRRIMINCALQRLRKIQLNTVSIEKLPFYENIKSVNGFHNLEVKYLIKLVQELSPVYRLVFNLYVFEGWKHKEIAKALNISEGTSKSNLNSARSVLQKKILNSLNIKTMQTFIFKK